MTIKAGDLVMVVRPSPCCGDTTYVGRVFVAGVVERAILGCKLCGSEDLVMCVENGAVWPDGVAVAIETECLIRIDPPADPVSVFDRVEEPA